MRDAEKRMKKNYRVALQYDPDGYWIAEHPELPGCKADGETEQEALSSLEISRNLWIESRIACGHEVPAPQEAPQYSGRFLLRIPKSLHRELTNDAESEGVSLNSFVSNILASRHSRKEQSLPSVSQGAFPYQEAFSPAFSGPERTNANSSNVLQMICQQQAPWSYQKRSSEIDQTPRKEVSYA